MNMRVFTKINKENIWISWPVGRSTKHTLMSRIKLNCTVIHELFVTTELPNDELTSIRT